MSHRLHRSRLIYGATVEEERSHILQELIDGGRHTKPLQQSVLRQLLATVPELHHRVLHLRTTCEHIAQNTHHDVESGAVLLDIH